jgi:hypothetical protein
MGALSDIVNMGHWGRMRMWLLAMAVAIVGTTALSASGLVDLAKSVPQRPVLPWLSLLLGGGVRRGHDAGRRLRQQEPGARGRRQRALAGGAGLPGHRLLHDAQGPVRPVARRFGWTRSINLGERGWSDQSLATALARPPACPRARRCGPRRRCCRWRWRPLCSRTSASAATPADRGRGGAGPAGGGGLVRHRPPGLRREPRNAGDGLLRHQHRAPGVAELRGPAGLQRWNC